MNLDQQITEHRGVQVWISSTGQFFTTEDSKYGPHTAPSLEALKKKIDAAGAVVKGPAKAFMLGEPGWRNDKATIDAVNCGNLIRSTRGVVEVWITSGAHKTRQKMHASGVYEDTPENRALAEEWKRLQDAARAAEAKAAAVVKKMKPIAKGSDDD